MRILYFGEDNASTYLFVRDLSRDDDLDTAVIDWDISEPPNSSGIDFETVSPLTDWCSFSDFIAGLSSYRRVM